MKNCFPSDLAFVSAEKFLKIYITLRIREHLALCIRFKICLISFGHLVSLLQIKQAREIKQN